MYLIGLYGSSVLVRPVNGIPSLTIGVTKLGDNNVLVRPVNGIPSLTIGVTKLGDNNEHVLLQEMGSWLLVNTLSHSHDMVWVGRCDGGRATDGCGLWCVLQPHVNT